MISLLQIGPHNFSVFDSEIRTTSAIEAYNSVIGKSIPKKATFFKFVAFLQMQEFEKVRKFELLMNTNGSVGKKRIKKSCVLKADMISKFKNDLLQGTITPSKFLDQLVLSKNNLIVQMEPDEDLFEELSYLEEDIEDESLNHIETNQNTINNNMCVVCFIKQPNILFFPCKHLKICSECCLTMQTHKIDQTSKLVCPFCRAEVHETLQIFI